MSRGNATREELDARLLIRNAAFQRFLLRIAERAGIWMPTAGADHTLQYREGRRSLGLEILGEAALGLPRGAGAEHVLALILTDATTPKETDDDPDRIPDSER